MLDASTQPSFTPTTVELGATNVPDDHKVNLGACLLRSALGQWARRFSKLYLSGAPLPGLDDPVTAQLPHFSPDMPPAGKLRGRRSICVSGEVSGCLLIDCLVVAASLPPQPAHTWHSRSPLNLVPHIQPHTHIHKHSGVNECVWCHVAHLSSSLHRPRARGRGLAALGV